MGCAHQIALNLKIEGGHSPPYNKNTGTNQGGGSGNTIPTETQALK
ncbi:hypothetical protein D1AOALGA4SA_11647 [Olavius algarvensis Delta 1 endosymbiont]|nr:hypothetical protein D1AOALGA4SA_11647 [Olavius algarvensis Delta 1 endosymbiont]